MNLGMVRSLPPEFRAVCLCTEAVQRHTPRNLGGIAFARMRCKCRLAVLWLVVGEYAICSALAGWLLWFGRVCLG